MNTWVAIEKEGMVSYNTLFSHKPASERRKILEGELLKSCVHLTMSQQTAD